MPSTPGSPRRLLPIALLQLLTLCSPWTLASTSPTSSAQPLPHLFTWDAHALHTLRQTLSQSSDLSVLSVTQLSALRHLSDQASRWEHSVSTSTHPIITNKTFIPPGATLHHFVSLVPYAHACSALPAQCTDYQGRQPQTDPSFTCDQATGLPWVICDGLLNHAAKFSRTDRPALELIMHAIIRLSLRAYLFRDAHAARAANVIVDTWFVQNSTRMLPSLRFAQGVPGVTDGKPSGCIDLSLFGRGFADAVALLSQTPEAHWESQQGRARSLAFRQWCASMADEMLHNVRINPEVKMRNNHGLYYDLTVLSLSLLAHHPLIPLPLDNHAKASTLAETISKQTSTMQQSASATPDVPAIPFISFSAADVSFANEHHDGNTEIEGTRNDTALFIGVRKNAKTVSTLYEMLSPDCEGWVRCVKGRLDDQTDSSGAQVHELDRVGFGHYVWYTLLAHVHLYTTARSAGAHLPLNNDSTSVITPVLRIAHWTLRNFDRLTGTQGDEWLVYGAQAYRIISRLTGESIYELKACELLREMYRYSRSRRDKNYFLWHDIRIGMDVWNLALPSIDMSSNDEFNECEVWNNFPTTFKVKSPPSPKMNPAGPTSTSTSSSSSNPTQRRQQEFATSTVHEAPVTAESLSSLNSLSSSTKSMSNFSEPAPLDNHPRLRQARSMVVRDLYSKSELWRTMLSTLWTTLIIVSLIWAFMEAVHKGRPHQVLSPHSSLDVTSGGCPVNPKAYSVAMRRIVR